MFNLTYTVMGYIITVCCYLAYAFVVACWALIIFNAIQFFTGWPSSNKDILPFLLLEKTVEAQICAIHKEQRRTVRKIEKLVPLIDRWNDANLLVMKDIRSAEVIIKERIPHFIPQPDRPRFHNSGLRFRVIPTFEEEQAESHLPSSWALIRWLKNQDERPVFEARKEANRLGRIHTMRARAFEYLQSEHERLRARLVETRTLNKEAWEMPEPVKPACRGGAGGHRRKYHQHGHVHQAQAWSGYEAPVYQQPIVSEYTRRLEEVQKYSGQVMHWCTHCDERHTWLHQYPNLVAALSVPQFYPCQAAVARHALMCATFGLIAPPPPPPPPPTTTTTAFLQQQQQQPIYAAAPRPWPAAGHSSFPARPNTPAPLPSVATVAKPPSTFLQTVLNQQAASTTASAAPPPPPPAPPPSHHTAVPASVPPAPAAPAVRLLGILPPIIEPQPSNAAESNLQSVPRGKSLFERMLFGADGQPLRATAAVEERQGEEDKENSAPRGRSREQGGGSGEAQPRAQRRQARGEEFEERRREVLGERARYRF